MFKRFKAKPSEVVGVYPSAMTAAQARARRDSELAQRPQRKLTHILTDIEDRADAGNSYTVRSDISPGIRVALEELGYTVAPSTEDPLQHVISW